MENSRNFVCMIVRHSVAEPEPEEQQFFAEGAGAKAEIFGPAAASGMQNHIKFSRRTLFFHRYLKFEVKKKNFIA
jgi:hypothetical protein